MSFADQGAFHLQALHNQLTIVGEEPPGHPVKFILHATTSEEEADRKMLGTLNNNIKGSPDHSKSVNQPSKLKWLMPPQLATKALLYCQQGSGSKSTNSFLIFLSFFFCWPGSASGLWTPMFLF